MCALKWQPTRKRRRLLEPSLNEFGDKNERKRPLRRKGKSMSSAGSGDMMLGVSWRRKEPSSKRNTTTNAGLPEPVLTLLLTPWDGVNMNGPKGGHMRVLHGLGTYGAPAPWTINN